MYRCTNLIMAIALISISCTTSGPRIQDPPDDCPKEFLCAGGEGSSRLEAEQNARESLAKTFEIRISGTTESLSSQEHIHYRREHNETFDEVLQGVQILRLHREKNNFFALASLHKKKSAQSILRKAKQQDALLLQHYRDNDLERFTKVFKRYQALEERHFFLTGMRLPPQIGYEKMLQKMEKLRAHRAKKTILVETETDELKQHLIKNLTMQGYRTISQENQPFDIKLIAKMNVQQLYFNVPRFKKYEFSLQIYITNAQGIQKNVLLLKQNRIGRSEEHATELAMENIFMGLEKNIDSLLMGEKI